MTTRSNPGGALEIFPRFSVGDDARGGHTGGGGATRTALRLDFLTIFCFAGARADRFATFFLVFFADLDDRRFLGAIFLRLRGGCVLRCFVERRDCIAGE